MSCHVTHAMSCNTLCHVTHVILVTHVMSCNTHVMSCNTHYVMSSNTLSCYVMSSNTLCHVTHVILVTHYVMFQDHHRREASPAGGDRDWVHERWPSHGGCPVCQGPSERWFGQVRVWFLDTLMSLSLTTVCTTVTLAPWKALYTVPLGKVFSIQTSWLSLILKWIKYNKKPLQSTHNTP